MVFRKQLAIVIVLIIHYVFGTLKPILASVFYPSRLDSALPEVAIFQYDEE